MRRKFATTGACLAGRARARSMRTQGGGETTSAENYPEEPLEWTVAFGPGGGNDIMSRTDRRHPGDGGHLHRGHHRREHRRRLGCQVGWGKVHSNAGNGVLDLLDVGIVPHHPARVRHRLGAARTSPTSGCSRRTRRCSSPRKDSNLDTWEKWVEYAKDKGKVAVGGIGVVNVDLILHNELAKQAGYEIEYVPFNEEAQLITGLVVRIAGRGHLEPCRGARPGRVGRHEPAAVHR